MNQAFVRYITIEAKFNPAYKGLDLPTALNRARRAATMDLLDGHIMYVECLDQIIQPRTCGSHCIRCNYPESTWPREQV